MGDFAFFDIIFFALVAGFVLFGGETPVGVGC